MENFVINRLKAINDQLISAYNGGLKLSSSSKGREREYFINLFLKNCLPPQFRFGSGDIFDTEGKQTGQLDIVMELPFFPSLPLLGGTHEKLYFAEGVGLVIEVKSDLRKQWKELTQTGRKIRALHSLGGGSTGSEKSRFSGTDIPFIAVGFEGWENPETIDKLRANTVEVDAILQINNGISSLPDNIYSGHEQQNIYHGGKALGSILIAICDHLTSLTSKDVDLYSYLDKI